MVAVRVLFVAKMWSPQKQRSESATTALPWLECLNTRNLVRCSFDRNQITTVLGAFSSPRWVPPSGDNSEFA